MDDLENAVNDWAVHIELLGQVGSRPAKGSTGASDKLLCPECM